MTPINGSAVIGAGDGTILLVLGLKESHQFLSVIIASTEFSLAGSIVFLCVLKCRLYVCFVSAVLWLV